MKAFVTTTFMTVDTVDCMVDGGWYTPGRLS